MARIRSIHPGLFTDEGYMGLSLAAKATWPGVWTEADDHGVFEWKPITLKAKLMPVDNVNMTDVLAEFVAQGLASQFTHEGKSYGVIKGFLRWQRPREPSYRYPFPKEAELIARNDGTPDAGLPQDCVGTPEKSPQREEGGGMREEGESETSPPSSTSGARKARADRGTRIPDDWAPDDGDRAFAVERGLDADAAGVEFRDYWRTVPGAKGRKLDWSLAFKNRCRELAQRSPSRFNGPPQKQGGFNL